MTCKLRPATKRGAPVLEYHVASETWRFYAYINIWIVFISAILMTRKWVVPYLAGGPEVEGDTCGPFNRKVRRCDFLSFIGMGA